MLSGGRDPALQGEVAQEAALLGRDCFLGVAGSGETEECREPVEVGPSVRAMFGLGITHVCRAGRCFARRLPGSYRCASRATEEGSVLTHRAFCE